MNRYLSNYLSFPCADTARRLVLHANSHIDDLCRASAFDLGVLAEATTILNEERRAMRVEDRRLHRERRPLVGAY